MYVYVGGKESTERSERKKERKGCSGWRAMEGKGKCVCVERLKWQVE